VPIIEEMNWFYLDSSTDIYELVFSVPWRVLLDELFESGVTEEILVRDSVDIESNRETESENEGNVL